MAVQSSIQNSRDRLGLSRAQLAERLGVNTLTVIRWEEGKFLPRRQHWPKIKEVLGLELNVVAEQREAAE